jgi:hypothetical protein
MGWVVLLSLGKSSTGITNDSLKLDATGHRWLADLATYDFNIKYRPGKNKLMQMV